MWLIYDLIIHLYGDAISVAALFNDKAKAWLNGRRGWKSRLQSVLSGQRSATEYQHLTLNTQHSALESIAWFHCASLGEFEQGRPVIEAFRATYPDWKILLTFFSPSGYEVRKEYAGADWVFYLPLDTPGNAKKFVDIVRPSVAIFVKYEFWFRYLDALYKKKIPVYVISANFRKNHHFFRWYGGWMRRQLRQVTRFFVQHEESAHLLKGYGINQVTVSGDTRFDRVAAIVSDTKKFPQVEKLAIGKPLFIAGSTWPADEEIILKLIGSYGDRMKFVIAPHEVGLQRVTALRSAIGGQQPEVRGRQAGISYSNPESGTILFSELTEENAASANILIIDGIGYLSHLYQYATIAYIGGGFGAGIHNILEAAAFGKPVIFGPNFHKFREAADLISAGGAFSVNNFEQLNKRTIELLEDQQLYKKASGICSAYINRKQSATGIILSQIIGSKPFESDE